MEIAVGEAVVSKVTDQLVDSIWRQIGYIWNYSSNIQGLKSKVEKLKAEKVSVMHRVEEAIAKGEEIEEIVSKWLTSADEAMKLQRLFSTKIMIEQTRKFEVAKDYETFDSRNQVLEEIIGALKDADVNLIGVYGLGGVGKTTLLKQVTAQVKETGIFKVVATATVTDNPDLNKIQQDIADWLGLKFDVESTQVRAARLRARLKQDEKVLVILDNIWHKIALEELGIPYGNDHKGCKILMTSRNLNVLLAMDVQRHFLLRVLQDEEAWQLFEKKAGEVKDPTLHPIATQIARKCAGLPVLIVAVATALKNKELCEWRDALEDLNKFDKEGYEASYTALKLSYNFLGAEEKSLFVLCGQLKAHYIVVSDLLKYSLGLGLFNQRTTVKAARNRLLKVVNDLKRSCLLLEGDDDDEVRMHDVVHNFATLVASRDHHVFAVACDSGLEEWPEKDILEQFTAISLPDCKIPKLPEVFECPDLQSFLLYNKDSSLKIPDNFFSRMKKLKLMDLSNVHLSPMPLSLQCLENLQTLCLDRCTLEDIAAIGELKKLQVLSFIGSTMVQLPREVGKLTRLQLLDLSRCQKLEVIPKGVLSCLTKLEELYMGNSFVQWESEEHDGDRNNASLDELKLLPNLVTLELHIINAEILPRDVFSEKLDLYKVFIGEEWSWFGKYEASRTLKLKLNSSIEIEKVKVLLMTTEDLYLDELEGVRNVLYELDGQGFPQLKHLHIQNSSEIQYIVDCLSMGNHYIAFPRLESLLVDNLNNLGQICYGQLMSGSFSKLRKLKVEHCNALKNLFYFSMFRGLVQLEEIDVSSCNIMEEIVVEEIEDDSGRDEIIKPIRLRTLTLEYLPRFTSFCSQRMQKLAGLDAGCAQIISETPSVLFGQKIEFSNLLNLKLSSINNMEKIWRNQVKEPPSSVQNLTSLIVEGCGKLSYLFTSSMVENLSQLEYLEISDCSFMEEIIVAEGLTKHNSKLHFPILHTLKLKSLPNLIRFCFGNLIECPSLNALRIENCPRLLKFISSSASTNMEANRGGRETNSTLFDEKVSFPILEKLEIVYMNNLRMIWESEDRGDSFCKLKIVKIQNCKELVTIFPSKMLRALQKLEDVVVTNCDLLEEVFNLQELMATEGKQNRVLPVVAQLRDLTIENLPSLKHVWSGDPQGVFSFDNLRSLSAENCPSLKNLFPASIAKSLSQLEDLSIVNCGLQEIVAKDRVEATPRFVFPQLKSMKLWILEEVKNFYPGRHILDCPKLEKLTIHDCDNLELFTLESQCLQVGRGENQVDVEFQQPLFSFTQVVSHLKSLSLSNKETMMIRQAQLPASLFHKLERLDLQCFHDRSSYFPFDLLQRFQNVETLLLTCSNVEDLFPYPLVGEDNNVRILSNLRHLTLNSLRDIRRIWNQECQPNQSLQNLETLEVMYCKKLINLAPSSATFKNLASLEVHECNGLVSLLTSTTAKSLVQLGEMKVSNCKMLREIVANEGDEMESEITFSKLESLRLDDLTRLTTVCSVNCRVKFPSLEELIVTACPRMEFFSHGIITAPKLEKVSLTKEGDKWRSVGDLNTTTQQLYREMVGLNGVQHLQLSEFPTLVEKWHDQLPAYFFYNLKSLVVDNCSFPSSSVPSNLLPFLNELEVLEVRNCDSLAKVFDFEWSNDYGYAGHLPNLKKFHLIDLPRLRHIWDDISSEISGFKNLTVLNIHNCSSLRYIFNPIICMGLVQLQEVEVRNCALVQAIIREGLAKEEAPNEIIFPLLKSISLESLPSLINFFSGSGIVRCPSLKEITIVNCPATFTCTLLRESESNATDEIIETKVEFSELKILKLFSINIEKIWHAHQLEMYASIQHLASLTVDGCGHLKHALSSSMVQTLVHLKKLEVCNCRMMEEVIATEGFEEESTSRMLLRQLEFLKLKDLPELAQFFTSNLIEFPVMKELWLQNCPKLVAFVSSFGREDLALSSELEISKSTLFNEKVAFPKLKKLQIFDMNNFKIFSSNMLLRLQNLDNLVIKNCSSLEEVFDLRELIKVEEQLVTEASQLETLEIHNLPNLKHVWNEDPKGIISFEKLSSVEVWECPCLKSIFPTSVAKHLPQLEALNVDGCGVEEIVSKEDGVGVEETSMFVFPRLKFLDLWRLQELKSFYPGIHTLECPVLEQLIVYRCDKLETFSYEQGSQETHTEGQQEIQAEQPLFCFTKVVPNLCNLSLSCDDIKAIREGQFSAETFNKLNTLHLYCFHDTSFDSPCDLLHKFQNVHQLILRCSNFKVLFSFGVVDESARILSQLRYLKLDYLPDMKEIWSQDCPTDQTLQNLETLEIWGCHSLISLASGSAGFQNLETLDVYNCDELLYLVTSSVAKSLVHLTKMTVRECNILREVVASEADEPQGDIIFSKLENLRLYRLESLIRFCSASITIQFPSLKDVEVTQCPNMMDFSRGVIRAPKLQKVCFAGEERWVEHLNTTIQQLYKENGEYWSLISLNS
ncbi:phosphoprotein phosphatase, putative [Ricinus communis]|uniref:Phosphoprotein phosphatase, putative n=1 Tax=Ricinus communis TaxID=3988 RepID=B9REY6_RICCO|nr:phosphoprotein phosphatase, putative [Ricinus communis]